MSLISTWSVRTIVRSIKCCIMLGTRGAIDTMSITDIKSIWCSKNRINNPRSIRNIRFVIKNCMKIIIRSCIMICIRSISNTSSIITKRINRSSSIL